MISGNEESNLTIQQKMKMKLESIGLPFYEIQCYGNHITIECLSKLSCEKWIPILKKISKIKGIIKSNVYAKTNKKTQMNPSIKTVFRLYSVILPKE